MARPRLKLTMAVIAMGVVGATCTLRPSQAAMPVIDTAAIAKLTDQLSKLQDQIDVLTDLQKKAQDQINAIGKMGQITLPMVNMARMVSRLRSDAQCLVPDFSKLMPSVDFEDVNFGSICEGGNVYQKTLFLDPDELKNMPWEEQRLHQVEVKERRQRVVADTVAKSMAAADMASKVAADETGASADELEGSVSSAKDSNDRLAAIATGQVLIVRALAQQNQILAMQLKVQAATALALGVRLDSDLVKEADGNGDASGGNAE